MRKRFSSKQILLSMAALGTAGAMAGLGTYATFTDTTSSSNTATSGKVVIDVGADGTRPTVSASTRAPSSPATPSSGPSTSSAPAPPATSAR